jgi:hypothetical protein
VKAKQRENLSVFTKQQRHSHAQIGRAEAIGNSNCNFVCALGRIALSVQLGEGRLKGGFSSASVSELSQWDDD